MRSYRRCRGLGKCNGQTRTSHPSVVQKVIIRQVVSCRWVALDEGGRIYSYKPSSQGTRRKHLKLLYKVEPTTKINYSIEWFRDSRVNCRTCILELKTNNDRVFQLKAKDPLLLQNWAQHIQRFLASSRSKSGEYRFFLLWECYLQGTKANGSICGYG